METALPAVPPTIIHDSNTQELKNRLGATGSGVQACLYSLLSTCKIKCSRKQESTTWSCCVIQLQTWEVRLNFACKFLTNTSLMHWTNMLPWRSCLCKATYFCSLQAYCRLSKCYLVRMQQKHLLNLPYSYILFLTPHLSHSRFHPNRCFFLLSLSDNSSYWPLLHTLSWPWPYKGPEESLTKTQPTRRKMQWHALFWIHSLPSQLLFIVSEGDKKTDIADFSSTFYTCGDAWKKILNSADLSHNNVSVSVNITQSQTYLWD